MSEWKETVIGAVCDVGDGAHSKVERQKKGVPYLTSKNFNNGSLKQGKRIKIGYFLIEIN
jgi:type I restriction enzyme, S subunit